MSENGLFRKSITGFNKKDVHNYIDMLLLRHLQERAEKDEQINELIAQINSFNTADDCDNKIDDLQKLIETKDLSLANKDEEIAETNRRADKLYDWNKHLQTLVTDARDQSDDYILKEEYNKREKELIDKISGLQALLDEAEKTMQSSAEITRMKFSKKAEDFELFKKREQILMESSASLRADKDSIRTKLHECQRALADCERELERSKYKVRENEKMLGNVGAFVMEMHSLGNQVLENTSRRSEDSLNTLEAAINSMAIYLAQGEKTLKTARDQLVQHNEISNARLEELINDMKTDMG